jgi:glycine/D-amino acid oxidase-like deaminating enzyme
MKHTTHPTWDEDVKLPSFNPLEGDISTDVVIIGGGITGILSAYLLSKEGKKVVLIEKNSLATGATPLTTACTTQIIDTDLKDLIKIYGADDAEKILSSHGTAINTLEQIIRNENIECEFMRCPNFVFAKSAKEHEVLKEECGLAAQLGLKATFKEGTVGNLRATAYMKIERQAKFHPLKLLAELIQICRMQNVLFFENTEALDLDPHGTDIRTPKGTVYAKWIISATYKPFTEPAGLYLKKGMYRSYVLELQAEKQKLEEAIYEDLDNPYHYFRVDRKETHDRIIFGGEDHREDLPVNEEKNFKALEEHAAEILGNTVFTIMKRWHGPILEPSDGLPLIGPYKNMLLAAAFSGNGMTYSTIAALMFRDHIIGRHNEWNDIYNPGRTLSPHSLVVKGKDYAGELWGGAIKNTFKK